MKSRLYDQVGTKKFGRRTDKDVQVKIIFRIRHIIYFGRDCANWMYKRVELTTDRRITETRLYHEKKFLIPIFETTNLLAL